MKAGMKFGKPSKRSRVEILTFWGSLFAVGSGLTSSVSPVSDFAFLTRTTTTDVDDVV